MHESKESLWEYECEYDRIRRAICCITRRFTAESISITIAEPKFDDTVMEVCIPEKLARRPTKVLDDGRICVAIGMFVGGPIAIKPGDGADRILLCFKPPKEFYKKLRKTVVAKA